MLTMYKDGETISVERDQISAMEATGWSLIAPAVVEEAPTAPPVEEVPPVVEEVPAAEPSPVTGRGKK